MPEIAAIGFVGALLTFLAVNLNLYSVHKSFKISSFVNLNSNLAKVGYYWSQDQGQLVLIPEGSNAEMATAADYSKATRSAFLFGTLMIFLSWLGLFIFLIYWVSITKLARSRMQRMIFDSPLTQDPQLDPSRVQAVLNELKQSV